MDLPQTAKRSPSGECEANYGDAVSKPSTRLNRAVLVSQGSTRRSFAAVGKTMVGLGRNGRSRSTTAAAAAQSTAADLRTVDSTLVFKVLRPYFWVMRICGIFFIRPRGAQHLNTSGGGGGVERGKTFEKLFNMPNGGQVFSCFVCILFGANFLRSISAFDSKTGFNYTVSFKVTWMVLWFEGFTRTLLAAIFWYRHKGGYQEFFVRLDTLFFTDGIVPYEDALAKMMTSCVIVIVVVVVASATMFSFGIFADSPDLRGVYNAVLAPYTTQFPDGVPVAIGYVIRATILIVICGNMAVSFVFIGFFCIVCYLFYKEFEYLSRTFKLKITDDGRFTDDLERFRVNHQNRCKMVECMDELFKHFIANTYLVEIPVFCLLLYTLLLPSQSPATKAMDAFWMLFFAGQTIVVSVACIAVNTQAHEILSSVYSLTASNASSERQLEINMFLTKLTGSSVGLTAWDMFNVDKPAMLTIIGLLLSFFFLLMQFNNPLQVIPGAQCNCTNSTA